MFGDNDYEEWSDFLQEYSPPPYNLPGTMMDKMVDVCLSYIGNTSNQDSNHFVHHCMSNVNLKYFAGCSYTMVAMNSGWYFRCLRDTALFLRMSRFS